MQLDMNYMEESIIPEDIAVGQKYEVGFKITPMIAERFSNLTDDHSSLHTKAKFARRSMYRENVVHGMLPVMFLSAVKVTDNTQVKSSFDNISAVFAKPVFVGDHLRIVTAVSAIDQSTGVVEFKYKVVNKESNTVVTVGKYTMSFYEQQARKVGSAGSSSSQNGSCMLESPLEEQVVEFDRIQKGDSKEFKFCVGEESLTSFYRILEEGLDPQDEIECAAWVGQCNIMNLLANSLLSTFVGMCIPGQNATFVDFKTEFSVPVQKSVGYTLKGTVVFKSASTHTLVEEIEIYRNTKKAELELVAKAKISARINQRPTEMPSVEYLKKNEMDLNLKDKVVLITGASRGIGETTAKMLSIHGAKVAVNYFQGKDDAEKIVAEIKKHGGTAVAIQADVSKKEQVKDLVEMVNFKLGPVDILVNNAVRNAYPISFMEQTWDDFQKDIDVIIKGAFYCCQEVITQMISKGGGKIINISTVFTDNPTVDQSKYIISKSGLVGLTRSLAVELADKNIQVNMVVPSIVETDLSKHVPKIVLENMKGSTPMKRNATPVDVAKAIVFLSSNLSSFTTGQKIMVTGGNGPFL